MPWATENLMNKRTEFALRALQKEHFVGLCREYKISRKTGYKWLDRFKAEGLGGMRDQSRQPKNSPEKLEEEVVCRMVRLKERHRQWGPKKIREIYVRSHGGGPSESSFKRVLERCGLTEKRRVKRMVETGRIASGRKASQPNEVWTIDFKGWWYDKEGRCEPLTVRDEYSRYVLEVRALGDGRGRTVQTCLERLFERYGLPGAIRSDNGTPFACTQALLGLSKLSVWWLANGIDLERSRPGCPQDNGGHERMHRDMARELEGVDHEERQAALDTWRREFNEERPHQALGMKVPSEIYRPSERIWKGTPQQIEYPGMAKRRVSEIGRMHYEGEKIFLTCALAGWDVGLKYREEGSLEVYFSQLLLGRLESETAAFIPARALEPKPKADGGATRAH